MAGENAAMAELWNGRSGENWIRFDEHHDRGLRPWGEAVLAAAAPAAGERVLDVGCGTGWMTRTAARATAAGHALGVDISALLVARARATAEAEGVGNVAFTVGDAQDHPFEPASVEVAISRFGVMFFADAVAAFANVGRALAPGGRLAFACWQGLQHNDWIRVPFGAMTSVVGPPEPVPPDAPGPWSLADPDRVRSVLGSAGFSHVALDSVEAPMWLGGTAGEAYDFIRASNNARLLLGGKDPEAAARALDALRTTLEGVEAGDAGLALPGAAWLVTATRP
jgi:SAM-dependent methyltransferase